MREEQVMEPRGEITGVYGAVLKRFTRKMFGEVPEAQGFSAACGLAPLAQPSGVASQA
jgi:hypothetical protein